MPHINEKIDFTVGIWIVFKQRVLLVDHKALKKWLSVGGHVELDEDPDEACIREIFEESGLKSSNIEIIGYKPPLESTSDRKVLFTPTFMDIHRISETHRHVGMGYLARANTDEVVLAEREHFEIKWFTMDMLSLREYDIEAGIQWYSKEALRLLAW